MQNKIIVFWWFSVVIHNKLPTNKNYLLNVLCIEIKILQDLELMILLLYVTLHTGCPIKYCFQVRPRFLHS